MKVSVFEFNFFGGINTYLLYDEKTRECVIIDPGMTTPEEEEALDKFISENHLKPTQIIITHLHIDHVPGIPGLQKKYGVPVKGNEGDLYLLDWRDQHPDLFGINLDLNDIKIDENLDEGDKIKIGYEELEVIAVPGHSKGSLVLYNPKDKFLITGDVLFNGTIGRTDLPGGNYEELIGNIKEKLLSLPEETVILPGHGPYSTIGKEKRS